MKRSKKQQRLLAEWYKPTKRGELARKLLADEHPSMIKYQ